MISIQTSLDSLAARRNMNLFDQFQSKAIHQLASGCRGSINKSGDDAASLAFAKRIASRISQLTQDANNTRHGLSRLQIVDGVLSNISTILKRVRTLATDSSCCVFAGDRSFFAFESQIRDADIAYRAADPRQSEVLAPNGRRRVRASRTAGRHETFAELKADRENHPLSRHSRPAHEIRPCPQAVKKLTAAYARPKQKRRIALVPKFPSNLRSSSRQALCRPNMSRKAGRIKG